MLDNIARVSDKTHEAFSKIPVFPLIGNNDLPGHYVLPNSTSDWYKTVLSHWAPLILCSACSSEVNRPTSMEVLQETFLEGGYYNASIGGKPVYFTFTNSLSPYHHHFLFRPWGIGPSALFHHKPPHVW